MSAEPTVWVMLPGVPGGPVRLTVPPPDPRSLDEQLADANERLADAVADMDRWIAEHDERSDR